MTHLGSLVLWVQVQAMASAPGDIEQIWRGTLRISCLAKRGASTSVIARARGRARFTCVFCLGAGLWLPS